MLKGGLSTFSCRGLARAWLALVLAAVLAGCAGEAPAPVYQQQAYVFGTLVDVTVYGEPEARARELTNKVLAEFDRLHRQLHAWKPSELSALNKTFAEGRARVKIDPQLANMLRDAQRFEAQSGDLFNPAIGRLIALWGFQSDEFVPRQPDPKAIGELVAAAPKLSDLVIEGDQVYSRNPAVQLDLGGYAKGYALDVAARLLRDGHVKGALINIGGNIMAIGSHGDRPWHVGIQHPRRAGALATLDLMDGEAIGTSGDYQRYFMLDGKRYCHVLDPRTGRPAEGVAAVTVIVPPGQDSGTRSDVLSKPMFVAGVGGWREQARRLGVEQVMLVDDKGEVYVTPGMKRRLHFLDDKQALHEAP